MAYSGDNGSLRSGMLAGFVISFTGAIFLSTKAIIIKKAFHATSVDALTLLTLRMLFSLPFYAVAAVFIGRRRSASDGTPPTRPARMTRRQWTWVAVLGILGYYISSYFDFLGLQYISAGLERLILFLYPSLAVLINAMAFRQRISRAQIWALVLTYMGIGIAYFGELRVDVGNAYFYWGSLLVFLCAITYAIYLAGMGRMVSLISPAQFTTYSMLVAAGAVFLHFIVRGVANGHLSLPSDHCLWMYSILLALVATVLPSFMISAGMKKIGANNAAIVTSIGPVSTILQAHFILGDPIFAEQIIGTVLVIAGVLLTGWKGRKPEMELD